MVARQLAGRGIRDCRVLAAMGWVPREWFLPPHLASEAYEDAPLPIGSGQTISQPLVVALMTEALAPRRRDRVLEIGTGSGYQTAILARLAGRVYTIERLPDLLVEAEERFRRLGLTNIERRLGDGAAGWPECAPGWWSGAPAACGSCPSSPGSRSRRSPGHETRPRRLARRPRVDPGRRSPGPRAGECHRGDRDSGLHEDAEPVARASGTRRRHRGVSRVVRRERDPGRGLA